MPDMDVLVWNSDSDGDAQPREAHLYEILSPSHFTLVLVSAENTTDLPLTWEEQISPWQEILRTQRIASALTQKEAKVQFDSFFGSGQSLLLVRPDSYLGFVGGQDVPTLIKWLNQWFPATTNLIN